MLSVTQPRPPSSFSTAAPPFVENRGAVRPAPQGRRGQPVAARTTARPGADSDAGDRRPPAGSAGPALTQRMVLFEHPLHGASWVGSGASGEAQVRARREPSQAAGPAAVTDPVTTKSAPARQAGLPARRFLSNHWNAAFPARGRRGGAAANGTESRGKRGCGAVCSAALPRCRQSRCGSRRRSDCPPAAVPGRSPLRRNRPSRNVRTSVHRLTRPFQHVGKPSFGHSVFAAAVGAG